MEEKKPDHPDNVKRHPPVQTEDESGGQPHPPSDPGPIGP